LDKDQGENMRTGDEIMRIGGVRNMIIGREYTHITRERERERERKKRREGEIIRRGEGGIR
jgi:hypothetical protein